MTHKRRVQKPTEPQHPNGPLIIRWGPIPGTAQEQVIDDTTQEAKLLFTGGYGSGKTMTLVGKGLQLSALNGPEVPGILLVPDYGHFEDTILEKIKSVDPDTGQRWFLEDSQFHYRVTRHGAHIFSWEGGGDWHIMSAIRPASIKGPERGWMIADEPGIVAYDAWRNAANRVRHAHAVCRQTAGFGTPEGMNWLASLFTETHEGSYYRIFNMHTKDNRELLKHQPNYMQQVLENATDQEARSYLGGEMVNLTGAMAYTTFNRALHWRKDVEYIPMLPLRFTFDFNVDPMSCVVGQIVAGPRGKELNVVDAIITGASWTPEICEEIIKRYGAQVLDREAGRITRELVGAGGGQRGWPGGAIVYGDATGAFGSTTSKKSNYDIIRDMLTPHFPVFAIHNTALIRMNPPERDRLNAMNAIFKDATGRVRCWIRKTEPANVCTTQRLVRSLEMTQIAPGHTNIHKPSGETHTHPGDALGYLVNAEFPARKPDLITGSNFSNADV